MVNSKMGMVEAHNDGALTEPMTKALMTLSRDHCLQGFNNYRRKLGPPAYKNHDDLTGDSVTATALAELYETVDKGGIFNRDADWKNMSWSYAHGRSDNKPESPDSILSPFQYFKLFVDNDMIHNISEQTNLIFTQLKNVENV